MAFRPIVGQLEDRSAPAVFTVTTTADNGDNNAPTAGSLRAAIMAANAAAGADIIQFAIPGAGVRTISPPTELPAVTDPVTINGSTVTLTGPGGQAIPATVSYTAGNLTAILDPTALLAFSTTYTARLTTGVRAADGTPLAAVVTWTFTTADPPPPPTVTARTPADGATLIPRDAQLTATFSRSSNTSQSA